MRGLFLYYYFFGGGGGGAREPVFCFLFGRLKVRKTSQVIRIKNDVGYHNKRYPKPNIIKIQAVT